MKSKLRNYIKSRYKYRLANTRPTLVKYQKLKLKRNQVAERAEDRNVLLLDTSVSYQNYPVVDYWLRMSSSLSTVRQKLDKVWHPEKNLSIQDLDWDNSGEILLVNVIKRYINVSVFSK